MIIAVAADGDRVAGHFGHCGQFRLYHAEGGEIVREEVRDNPGHRPGFLPEYLAGLGVGAIIAGGMGSSAVSLFGERNIQVVVGASGDPRQAAEAWLRGGLSSTGTPCSHGHGS